MRTLLAAAAVAALAAACTPAARSAEAGQGAPPQAGDTVVVGEVAVVGSAPMNTHVVVTPEGRRSVRVEGPLARELASLSNTRVSVRGQMRGGGMLATSYELLSVNGAPALFGTVERAPGGGMHLRLADGSRVALLGPGTTNLRPGQKAWVQGPASVQVQVYGVVTP